jgi:hypothetical protein
MTGSFYDGTPPAPLLPNAVNDPHVVPTGFWKIVATGDPLFVAAFSFDQNTPFPTENTRDCTAAPTSPVSGSKPRMENVATGGHGAASAVGLDCATTEEDDANDI